MARYSATYTSVTCAALADTVAATNATYPGSLRGGGASVLGKVNEVTANGEGGASNPTTLILARASTVSVGALSVGNNALMDAQATAPGTTFSWGNTAATSGAQRSSTLYLLECSTNAFGGIFRWQARYGEEITAFGNAANAGELLYSAKTGTGQFSGHMIYEVV